MMDAIKLMLSGIMLMLIAVFLIFCEAGGIAVLLAVIAVVLFAFGLFQRTNDPLSLDDLPQKKCPSCGKEYDFDYAKCPHCGQENS